MRRIEAIVWILFVVVAVGVDPWGAFAFGPLRWALTSTALTAGACMLLRERRLRLHHPAAWLWLGFLAWLAVATVAGRDPLYGWIGTPDRHLGWATYLLFAIAFVLGQQVRVDQLTRAAVTAGILVGGWVMAEWAGFALVDVEFADGRLGGPFGQPAYLGAACVLLIPISVGAALSWTARWRVAATLSASSLTVALLLSQTRGAWIGAVVGALAVAVVHPEVRAQWRRLLAGAVILIALVAVSPMSSRALSAFDPTSDGASGRIDEWSLGVEVLLDEPVLGVGPEGYRTAVGAAIDADYARDYGRFVIPDRAHNVLLDVGVAGGLPAVATFAALLWLVGAAALRLARHADGLSVGVAAGCLGFLAQQMFLFPTAEVDPLFWVAAGSLMSVAHPSTPSRLRRARALSVPVEAIALAALIIGALDVSADHEVDAALDALADGRVEAAAVHADAALERRPDSIRYASFAGRLVAAEQTEPALRIALGYFSDGLDVSPDDPVLLHDSATATLDLARISDDASTLVDSIDAFVALIATDPHNPGTRLEYGIALALSGDLNGAAGQFTIAADLAPSSTAPVVNLVRAYIELGRLSDASETVAQALERLPANAELEALKAELDR